MKSILGILIPTHNRGLILNENLKLLCSESLFHRVKVYISDNASIDDTRQICEFWTQRYSNISYTSNDENVGFDKNVLKLIESCEEDYAWLLGDDDFPTPNSVTLLLNHLENSAPDAVILNGAERNTIPIKLKSKLPSRIYRDHNEFLADLYTHQTWMSSIVFRRNLLSKFDASQFKDSYFIHAQLLNHALSKSDAFNVIFDHKTYITFPQHHNITNSYFKNTLWLFLDRWLYNIEKLPQVINESTRKKCIASTPVWMGTLIHLRGMGYFSIHDYLDYNKLLKIYNLTWLALLVCLAPRRLCALIIRLRNSKIPKI